MQRLLPPKLVVLLIAAMVVLSFATDPPLLAQAFRFSGVAFVIGGLALNLRNAQLFTKVGTNIKTFNEPNTLVDQGAFVWTRNPMYLGFALLLLGLALLFGNPWTFVGPVGFISIADRWYIPFEEQRLQAAFGTDYDEYRAKVYRWIGRKA